MSELFFFRLIFVFIFKLEFEKILSNAFNLSERHIRNSSVVFSWFVYF